MLNEVVGKVVFRPLLCYPVVKAGGMYPQTLMFENASPIRITVVHFIAVVFQIMPIVIAALVGFSIFLRKTGKYKLSLLLQLIPFFLLTIMISLDALI